MRFKGTIFLRHGSPNLKISWGPSQPESSLSKGLSHNWKSDHAVKKYLDLIIESEIAPSVKTIDVEKKIDNIKEQMSLNKYRSSVVLEGGTGFLKLKRIVDPDGMVPDAVQFGFVDNKQFFVKVVLPITIVELSR